LRARPGQKVTTEKGKIEGSSLQPVPGAQ